MLSKLDPRNHFELKKLAIYSLIVILAFGSVVNPAIQYETCMFVDSLGSRVFELPSEDTQKYINICPITVSRTAELTLGFNDNQPSEKTIKPQSEDMKIRINYWLTVIKSRYDEGMVQNGWKVDWGKSQCSLLGTCEFWYRTEGHNLLTTLGANHTLYLLIGSPRGLGIGINGEEYNVTRFSWTTGSTFAVGNTTCSGEVTTAGMAKQRSRFMSNTTGSGTATMYLVVNQTATADPANISGMCLSIRAGQAAANSLIAGADIADFDINIGDKVNGQWTITIQ